MSSATSLERPAISNATDHISVCVCTLHRPAMLATLMEAVVAQATDGSFTFEVVVIDNDVNRSAEEVVRRVPKRAQTGIISLIYDCEPERNISLARNRAVRCATGNLIAFIDDDEKPRRDWLLLLHRTLRIHQAHGVLGPVVPAFPPEAPRWLARGRVFDRKRHVTGTRIGRGDARTGNVILERELFGAGELWFDPAYGRTGGEDSDFFARRLDEGRFFVWCDEAVAHEDVPPERWTATFHLKRLWRSGTISGERIRSGQLPRSLFTWNLIGLAGSTVATAVSLLLPMHLRMRAAQKCAYCAGVVAASLGFSLLRYRD